MNPQLLLPILTLLFLLNSCKKDTGIIVDTTPIMGTMTDARDGEIYKTITLGNLTWLAENLRYNAPNSVRYPSTPVYYGRLYDWNTLMDGASSSASVPSGVRGLCPEGWHLPSREEFWNLERTLGMPMGVETLSPADRRGSHGELMKSTQGWYNFIGESGNGSNESGFNAYPAGYYEPPYGFQSVGELTEFWTSTGEGTVAYKFMLSNVWQCVQPATYDKERFSSCRCVKD